MSRKRLFSLVLTVLLCAFTASLFSTEDSRFLLAGNRLGIWRWDFSAPPRQVWNQGKVTVLVGAPYGYFAVSSQGILFSPDGQDWTPHNRGIETVPFLIPGDRPRVIRETPLLDGLAVNPRSPDQLIAFHNDRLYVSFNRGRRWRKVDLPSSIDNITSAALFNRDGLNMVVGTAQKGVYVRKNYLFWRWLDRNRGLNHYLGNREEIGDILSTPDGLFCAQSFVPGIYRYRPEHIYWQRVTDKNRLSPDFPLSGLSYEPGFLHYVTEGGIQRVRLEDGTIEPSPYQETLREFDSLSEPAECFLAVSNRRITAQFHHLYLTRPPAYSPAARRMNQCRGVYLPPDSLRDISQLRAKLDLLVNSGINMVSVDLKDKPGYLRFVPRNPRLREMGEVSNAVDVPQFLREIKSRDMRAVAMVLVFRDPRMYRYDGYRYAIKDKVSGKPWRPRSTASGHPSDNNNEYWVDPFATEVWEYNIAIARELEDLGFDEIQFDFIRFPIEGDNLQDAVYTHAPRGMSREQAILSFLRYARASIKIPISVDYYAYNCWFGVNGKTGQNPKLAASYIDIVCPMFYPSYLPPDFLGEDPYILRPFRLHYQGSFRTLYHTGKNVLVRPWAQAFIFESSHDREYFGRDYLYRQTDGIRRSLDNGFTFWIFDKDYKIFENAHFDY